MSNYYYNGYAPKRSNKYGAKKVTINGEKFDSQKEAERFGQLKILERAGLITELQRQHEFIIVPKQYDEDGNLAERECSYIADFVYKDSAGNLVVEDVKGYRGGAAYNTFVMKRKLMRYMYGIIVKET